MTTSLPTARLGWTDMLLTRVGFGAWAIGGGGWAFAWGDQDDDDSVAAIRHAVESGINWVDTAAVYGLGHSEEVVAAALADLPEADRPYVFTKGGLVWDESDRPRRRAGSATRPACAPRWRRRCAAWGWSGSTCTRCTGPPRTARRWRSTGRRSPTCAEGKIRAAGLSNHGISQLDAAEAMAHVDSLQPQFSLIHRDAAADVLLWCPRARDRGHRLQPDGRWPAHRGVHPRAGGQPGSGRLARQPQRLHRPA